MIDDGGVAPPVLVRRLLRCVIDHASIEQNIVDVALVNLVEGLPGEALDFLGVEVKIQHRDRVGGAVVLELVKGGHGGAHLARSQDDTVGLRLAQELLDGLEALLSAPSASTGRVKVQAEDGSGRTKPEEAPVATMVFARAAMAEVAAMSSCYAPVNSIPEPCGRLCI